MIRSASLNEREEALRFLFQHSSEQEQRITAALSLMSSGELSPDELLILHDDFTMRAVLLFQTLPGAAVLFWPPMGEDQGQDLLLQHSRSWLHEEGRKVAQALFDEEERALDASLIRNGFQHVSVLWYLRHFLHLSVSELKSKDRLTILTAHDHHELFVSTIQKTYGQTLDFPELNNRRTLEEILQGHQGEENIWWVALLQNEPVGVALMTAHQNPDCWELEYMGVTPQARGQGIGREILTKVLLEAKTAEMMEVNLTVDQRNTPARSLYRSMGFEPFDSREVYLSFLQEDG